MPGAPPAAEERKVVTVLFCDLVESTEIAGTLDPEAWRAILLDYYRLMSDRVEAHAGTVEKFIGDAVMAVFGLTATREDDARRALTTALAMQDALVDCAVPLAIRIGVHTGEVITTADPAQRQALVAGDVVNIAARLQSRAAPGHVLLSAATRSAAGLPLSVDDVGRLALDGVATPIETHRLLAVPTQEPTHRFDTPFVGRTAELRALDAAWGRVTGECTAEVVTVFGDVGIGKTRLVDEWLSRRAITAEPITDYATVRGAPVLFVLDDAQWSGSMVQRVVAELDSVLVLRLARPESVAVPGQALTLAPLSADESTILVEAMVDVEPDAVARIVAQGDGNPLYLAQLAVAVADGDCVAECLPPTLRALIAARIDRLEPPTRTVLRTAAVLGHEFDLGDLSALAEQPDVDMRALVRRHFVVQISPGTKYRFVSGITQRVAYAGLTKRRRAELHERYARLLAEQQPSDALIGEHIAMATRYYRELGLLDHRGVTS